MRIFYIKIIELIKKYDILNKIFIEVTNMMKIGVIPDSFQVPFKEAIILAKDIGATGIQPYVTKGEMAPENLSRFDREDIVKSVKALGLEFSAVCADFGMHFNEYGKNEEDIKRTMTMMDLARDLGTNIITTHIGKVPEDENCEEYFNIVKTIETLGKYGDKTGVRFATETGPEKAIYLKKIIEKADTKSAKVNLDPANFVMCCGQDPVEAVELLKDYIVHTHAKDGVMNPDGTHTEYKLGDGDVPFREYLTALKNAGYDGYLTIERERGATRFDDIKHAVHFLNEHLEAIY